MDSNAQQQYDNLRCLGEPDHDASTAIIHTALDSGNNFIDTADIYAPPGHRH